MSEDMHDAPRQRVRFIYEKGEPIKFISNNDEARLWERALRRADLPLLYKNGFNPQPHIQFAAPLGVGITGCNEPLDVSFSQPVPLPELQRRLQSALPPGVVIHALEEVPFKADALQSTIIGADYTILIFAEPDEIPVDRLQARIDQFLAATLIERERERKGARYAYNLRPLVLELHYVGYDPRLEEHRIALRVQQRSGATGRPDEVVDALGFDDYPRTLRRERLYFSHVATDAALFARYPIIDQADVLLRAAPPARKRGRRPSKSKTTQARSINERAGDEFA